MKKNKKDIVQYLFYLRNISYLCKRSFLVLKLLLNTKKRLHPLRAVSKKNKKGLASVILATNSPNSELVIYIITVMMIFVNKKREKF